jgi:hypothetical protein
MVKIFSLITTLIIGAYLYLENNPEQNMTEESAHVKEQSIVTEAPKAPASTSPSTQEVISSSDPVEQDIKQQSDSAIASGYITQEERGEFERQHREFAQMQAKREMDEMTEQYDEQL